MPSIKDIYQWYQSLPKMPSGLTPLQSREWLAQNSQSKQDIESKSFTGEILNASPAIISGFGEDILLASASYQLDYLTLDYKGHKAEHYRSIIGGSPVHVTTYLVVKYYINYDKSIFYESLRLLHNDTMVEVEGEIIHFYKEMNKDFRGSQTSMQYNIKLKLSQIRVIEKHFLHAGLLDDKLKYRPPPITSKCFIATAAFGDKNANELVLLQEFRDRILMFSTFGRFFVGFYSILLPPIAFVIQRSIYLRKLTRNLLRILIIPMIKYRITRLQPSNAGHRDTETG